MSLTKASPSQAHALPGSITPEVAQVALTRVVLAAHLK